MATLGSSLVTKEMEWNANMTEQSHLGAALIAKPHKLVGKMDQLFSAKNYFSDNPITSILFGGKKSEVEIGGTAWEWDMKGANTRPLVVIENVEPASNTTPGRYRRTFRIKLDENWYVPGDVIGPGTSNKRLQVRVTDEVMRHGDGWLYTVRMMTDDDADFIPVQYLAPGTPWSKLYSQYEEAAEQSGSTQFSLPITLESKMSKFRKKYKITDYASTEVLAVAIPDSNGKFHTSWMRYADVEYWQQWYRELERGAWYTRSTETVLGANGRPVRSGPGFRELLEDSHTRTFTHLTARLIEDYLMDIFYSRTKPGSKKRMVKGYTGEYGMIIFHRAIQDWMNKAGFIKNVEVFTDKVSSEYNDNSLAAGYQFVKYRMANGATLELIHNPLYDDREINSEIDEVTGFPIESQRITFLDFNGEGGDSNIKMVNKKDGFAFTYVEGLYSPYGPKKGGSSAHSGSYYEIHVEKSFGVQVTDITRCGELILDRE